MNKTFHSVWNASKQAYVAAAETVSAKGKPSSGIKVAAVMAGLMGSLLGQVANAQTAPPPNTLPTGGQVSAGQASISQSGANMVIHQSSNRASVNWQSFNVGKDAHVQFNQPSAASVTLNRVISADPSQIFGRITANGQVVLSNPAGVYFGQSARVDVGGIVATTHGISDADFMAGKNRFERNGSTGEVVNEGEIKAALGGYIALLAPEVRNQGAVIAHMGTVALAAGEAVDLQFDTHNRLTNIRVEPSQIAALVDNRHAVQAPGGLIIISAQSMDRLVGGVVKNSGRIEANGLQQQGGRIVLSASKRIDNTGTVIANATTATAAGSASAENGPAGRIEISAPEVSNSGSINATGNSQLSAGSVQVQATQFTQADTGRIDLSAPAQGGALSIQTSGKVQLQGSVSVQATQDSTTAMPNSQGGQISIEAQGDLELNNATLDASGGQGGSIQLRAGAPAQASNPNPLPTTPLAPNEPGQGRLAMMGHSTLTTRGRTGQGGGTTLQGEHIALLDNTTIDAQGATGGGYVLVGGDWQGGANAQRRVLADPNALHQATTVTMAQGASIDASATQQGDGGTVVLWSDLSKPDGFTLAQGTVVAKGGAHGGDGGWVETSGPSIDIDGFSVDTRSASTSSGKTGLWLIDPYDYIIGASQASSIVSGLLSSNVEVTTTNNVASYGSNGNNASAGAIRINSNISSSTANSLTLKSHGGIIQAAGVTVSTNGGGVTYWTDSDNNGAGSIFFEGAATINTNGGKITLAGGADSGGSPAGYASQIYATGQFTANSNGGNILLKSLANSNNYSSAFMGAANFDAGVGTITMDAQSTGSTVALLFATSVNMTSSNTGNAISLSGAANTSFGVVFNAGAGTVSTIKSTGAGAISINGSSSNPSSASIAGIYLFADVLSGSGAITLNGGAAGISLSSSGTSVLGQKAGQVDNSSSNISLVADRVVNTGLSLVSSGTASIKSSGTSFSSAFDTAGLTFGNTLTGLTIGKTNNTQAITLSGATSIAGPITLIGGDITLNAGLTATGTNIITLQGSGNVTDGASGFVNATNLLLTGGNVTLDSTSNDVTALAASGVSNLTYVDSNALTVGVVTATGISATGAVSLTGTRVTVGAHVTTSATTGTGFSINGTSIKHNSGITVSTSGANIAYTASNSPFTSGTDTAIDLNQAGGTVTTINAGGGNIDINASFASSGAASTTTDYAIAARDFRILTSGNGTINITADASNNTATGGVTGFWVMGSKVVSGAGAINITGTGGKASNASKGVLVDWNNSVSSASGAITLSDLRAAGLTGTYAGMTIAGGPTTNRTFIGANGVDVVNSSSAITLRADALNFSSQIANHSNVNLISSGTITLESVGTTFSSAVNLGSASYLGPTFGSNVGTVTIGKATSTANIDLNSAINSSGDISVSGGNVTIGAGLTAASGTVTLKGTGNVTDGASGFVSATNLLLTGGNVTLDSTSNAIGTIAASGVSNLTYVDSDALTLGTVGSTTGISGTGDVTFNAATVTGSSNIALAGGRALSVTQSGNSTYSGIVSGTGSTLTKLGAGTLNLTGANSYTGATTISAGTLQVGDGSTTGTLGSGAVTNNAALIFNRSNDLTVGGDISGTGTLTQLGAGTLTLTGTNSYSGVTTITAGTLQVGSGGTTGSLGSGAITNDAALTFNRSNNLAVVGNTSGTGTLTKLGAGILTLTGVSSYTGATTITSGGLVFSNNTRPSTPGFTGAGQLTIEPSTSFSAAFNTNSYTYATTLTGLTFGKSGNTADINVGNPITISGPISMEGGNIALNGNLTSTLTGATIWAKATGNITSNASRTFQTNNGHLTLWADSDANGTGSIAIGDNNTLNSANGSTSSGLSGGGNITLAGGNDTSTDGIPDGHAASSTLSGISLGTSTANSTSMYSGGGDVIVRGRSTTIISGDVLNRVGIFQWGSLLVDAGQGAVNFDGTSSTFYGISFVKPVNNTTAGAKHLQIISAKTSGEAISITGTSAATYGLVFDFSNPKEILATGGGGISITGSGGGSVNAIFLSNIDILATSGNIVLNGGSRGITVPSGNSATVGKKAGTGITTSTSNITLTGDQFSINSPTTVDTTGTLTVQPSSTSFSSPLTWPMDNLTIASGLTGLTLGKSGNTADITIGSATSIAGPINVFAGALNINAGLTTTNATTGNVTFNTATVNGSGNIALASGRALSVTQSGNSTYSGIVSGTNSTLTKLGTGTLTLTGANSYTGITTISAGTLQVGDGSTTGALGSGAVTNNAALSFNRSNDLTVANAISGTGNLNQLGAGTLTLTGTNSYSGITTISAGTLAVSHAAALGTTASGTTVASGATLDLRNVAVGAEALTINGGTLASSNGTSSLSGSVVLGADSTVNVGGWELTLSGVVSGTGFGFTKTGIARLVLSGSNSYTGTTTVNAGTLLLGAAGDATNTPLGTAASGTVVASGATLDLNGFTLGTAEALTINGTGMSSAGAMTNSSATAATYSGLLTLGSNSTIRASSGHIALSNTGTITGSGFGLTLDGTSTASSLDSILGTGAGTLTKLGTGTWTLTGDNTNTGTTTVSAGTLQVGAGSTTGALGSGAITNNATLTFNRSNDLTVANTISGIGTLTKLGAGTLTLTGTDSRTGGTTISAGTLQVGAGDTTGALSTGAVTNNAVLSFNRSNDLTVANAISGTGTLTKLGAGITTLSGVSSYTGNTTITSGGLVFSNNTRPSTSGFTGAGQLTIAPSTSFSAAFNTNSYTYATTLTGLTLGKSGNTSSMTVGSPITISGPISIDGGNITVNGALTTTSGSSGAVLLKATGNITSSASITTNGADITLWSNSATNTTTGSSVGGININDNVVLDSRTATDRTNSTHTLGGGAITLGGGSETTTTANGSTVPSGYAMNAATESGLMLGTNPVSRASNIQINSGGGHISLRGRTNQYLGNLVGIAAYEGLKINAGTTGDITLTGLSNMADTSLPQAGMDIQMYRNPSVAASTSATAATSFTTVNGNIVLTGITNSTHVASNGFQSGGSAAASALTLQATGTGSITINGSAQTIGSIRGDIWLHANVNLLAASGNITLNGQGLGGVLVGGINVGRLDGSLVPTSSSNITINTNWLTPFNSVSNFRTSGAVTVQSVGNNFASPLNYPNSLLALSSDVSALTLGKNIGSTAHTDTVNFGAATSIAGPIQVYAGNITVNGVLTTTSGSNGNVLLKASGGITSSASITTNGADITLWSNATTDTTTGSSVGGIQINDNVVLDSRTAADRTASTYTTGGGAITLGGGSATGSTANGTTVPTGYAMNYSGTDAGLILGSNSLTSKVSGVQLLSGGGHISVSGRSNQVNTYTIGLKAYEGLTVNAGTAGNITLTGLANSAPSTISAGIDIQSYSSTATNANADLASSFTTANGAVVFTGVTTSTAASNGLQFHASSVTTGVTVQATGTGSITLNGSTQGTAADVSARFTNILAASGNITLNGNGLRAVSLRGVNVGRLSGSSVTASSSNITVNANLPNFHTATSSFNTSGTVTMQPVGTSFSSAITFPSSFLTLSSDVSALTLGKSGNTANVIVDSAVSINGPINVIAGDITLNAGLTANGTNTITLQSSGNVTDGASGFVDASNLRVIGGNVTLNSASNAIGTLAASGVGSLTYVDSNALSIGTVGATNGVSATGAVSIATLTGDLTLSQNVATTNTSATALTLNAGQSAAAGTSTDGDILISGTPVFTAGTGGTIRLMTGSVAGSTGLLDLVGSGTGRFRYNSDESTSGFTAALGANVVNAIYRESPTATISGGIAQTITYGDSYTLPGTATDLVNGDSLTLGLGSPLFSTANLLRYSATPYNVTSNLAGLGYNVSGSLGTLAVNRKALSSSGFSSANKIYDGNTTAAVSGTAALLASVAVGSGTSSDGARYTGDVLSISGTATASFNTKDVATATTVSFGGLSLTGADAGNYTVTPPNSVSASITPKTVSLSATKTYDGTTDLNTAVTVNTGVGSETLSYSAATASDAHVATLNKYITAINLGNASDSSGGVASNYQLPTLNASNAPVTINAATLTPTLTNTAVTKVYDATTHTPSGFAPTYSFAGLVSGDTDASLSSSSMSYNNANVANATAVTVSGLTISSVTGNRGSQASDYVLDASSKSVSATITRAPLTVTANNDARFLTQADTANFAGVSYTGFVNGETASVLSGTPTVTRSNASNSAAGNYTGVLEPGGLTPGNYQYNYVNGDFSIVGSNQMLVSVNNTSTTYGTAAAYSITSAAYFNGTNVVTLGSGVGSIVDLGNNRFTVNDGASGSATFTVVPTGSQITSTAGQLKVGSYQLQGTSVTTVNAANFSNNLVMVGSHTVATKAVTASIAAAPSGKVYDGNTSMDSVPLSLSGLVTSDVVTANGVGTYASRNAGSSLNYTVDNLALGEADAANYRLTAGASLSGTNGTITAKVITLNPQSVNKTYDGASTYSASAADLAAMSALLGVSGDNVSAATLVFADKNVGNNKTLTASAATIADGNGGNNYTVTLGSNSTSAITRLNSVTWVGGASGNWFDPANWAGGAVPDLANVANVVIPSGVTVSFGSTVVAPAQSGAVSIDGLTGAGGNLSQSAGTLNVGAGGITLGSLTQSAGTMVNTGSTTLDSFTQSGGSFEGTGNMTTASFAQTGGSTSLLANLSVTQNFSQGSLGNVSVGGNATITDTMGGLQLGNFSSTGALAVNSTDGAITQASGTALSAQSTSSFTAMQGGQPAAIDLSNAGNDFGGAVSLSGSNVRIVDANALTLGNVTATGNLNATAATDLAINGVVSANTLDLTATTGNITQSAGSTITVATGPSNFVAGGTVTLGRTNHFTGSVNGWVDDNNPSPVPPEVDTGTTVGVILSGNARSITSPVTTLTSSSAPPELVLSASAGTSSAKASQQSNVSNANSEGVTIDVRNAAVQDQPMMAAVSLPKGSATLGTGFSFELPNNIRELVQTPDNIQATLPNGGPLPAWLKFNAQALRFEASAVPDGAFPMQVAIQLGKQRVMVVISERAE